MENKIFLGKYRVASDEIAQVAAEPATVAVGDATEQVASARIYRGVDDKSGRDVNVEVVSAGGFKHSVREKLEAEAEDATKISHVNIPELYDFGVEGGQLIYVTEYFDGTSAESWVNQHGPMPTGAVLRIALQVMSAMGAAAFHKISHHAINPANLLLVPGQTPEGDWPLVKVLHFIGVAPSFASRDMSVAAFDKSTHYASPEQLQGKPVDFRSEIYSLGATMWFLLTGAPPLLAPKGPLAMQPTTIGLAVDKLKGMPKRVRRLLAQMLSVDPAARPQDPLSVYRQIQDCVAQVERRESMAKKLGVPFLSGAKVAALPSRSQRPFPTKIVALAAILLVIATIASIAVASYLRHQRIRQAQEPIGVPIGVPENATQSAPPVTASAPPVVASAPTVAPAPPEPQQTAPATVVQTNQEPPVTAAAPTIKPLPTAPPDSAPAVVAQETKTSAPPPEQPAQTPAIESRKSKVESAQVAPPPPAPESTAPVVAANNQTTAPPPQPEHSTQAPSVRNPQSEIRNPEVAANNTKPVTEEASRPAPKKPAEVREENPATTDTEVATTARAVTPEVRRAEPAPPAEGEEEVAPPPVTEKRAVAVAKPKRERARKPKPADEEEFIPRAEPVEEEERIAEASMPQLPRNRTRAKFIGVTADGQWMFSLPNKKIVIVPPPPGG